MSGLALAGAISGAGQGLGQGLANIQQGFIQSGLLKERDEMENRRMQLTFEHQEKLQAEKIASDRALQSEKLASDRTIHEETLANAKEMNQTNAGAHIAAAGMTNAMHEKIAAESNALNKTLAEMKDRREGLNTAASLEISKNSAYVKIIQSAEDSIDRMRVDQAVLEKAAATALPGDPIFDRIKELDRQLGVAKKEVDLYKGALGERIGAPKVPETPKFRLPPELMRPGASAPQEAPKEQGAIGDSSTPLADFQLRQPMTPNTGMVDAAFGTYMPFLSSIGKAVRRASDAGKAEVSK